MSCVNHCIKQADYYCLVLGKQLTFNFVFCIFITVVTARCGRIYRSKAAATVVFRGFRVRVKTLDPTGATLRR